MDQKDGKRRYDRCLGWGREVYAGQPLAPPNGCETLSLCRACFWLVLLQTGKQTDAYNGDIRYRKEVSARLADDVRQGVHARKVMGSYQSWFGEGPELSVLHMLGLFDRPVDERTPEALLKAPAIFGITESLAELHPTMWRTILARLRRTRLLAAEDPLFARSVTNQRIAKIKVSDINPAHAVRGPKYVVKKGETPVLTADEARTLLDSIPIIKTADENSVTVETRRASRPIT
jgi:hypothetical protein